VSRRYAEIGKPPYPTAKQWEELRQAAQLPPAEKKSLSRGELELSLPPKGLAVVEFGP
jgi:hypothetical protein